MNSSTVADGVAAPAVEKAPRIVPIFDGKRLRELRVKNGLRAEDLAAAADVTPRHVWRLETGKRPNVAGVTLGRLALALDTSIDYLMCLTDDPAPRALSSFSRLAAQFGIAAERLPDLIDYSRFQPPSVQEADSVVPDSRSSCAAPPAKKARVDQDGKLDAQIAARRDMLLELLRECPGITYEQLVSELEVTAYVVQSDVTWLKRKGFLRRVGNRFEVLAPERGSVWKARKGGTSG